MDAKTRRAKRTSLLKKLEAAEQAIPKILETLERLKDNCPHTNVRQPDYWKTCLDCGLYWPGT
jgi:hypothetical protein